MQAQTRDWNAHGNVRAVERDGERREVCRGGR